ncbi:SNF2-related protein [Microvirga pakistanensis]|uniref:SNF2-related protein n=1 Tax=Microvirga pakistanensis TaxID=1682650 RepID=UPI00106B8200|nr:SNF2-related protein [Microvirga pakistanensis]
MVANQKPMDEIDFTVPNIRVRVIYDASKVGLTTGRTRKYAGRNHALIQFVSGEIEPYPFGQLELAPENETRASAIQKGRFSGPDAIQRALLTEKIRGRLTDIFYAMGSGQADFHAHQFKPALKFVSSTVGRILIADEVGLGKTIEAIYIWRELQARVGARRLLVVCPAVLRTKWQNELRERFSIDATIVNASTLLELSNDALRDPTKSFVAIAGLESIRARRPKADDPQTSRYARDQLAALLAENEAGSEFSLFDLVVIDEAHYMRNPETANHHTGSLLTGASAHLALLTATPIQIGSENLYHLLNLVDPERFLSLEVFNLILDANRPLTQALNAVLSNPPRPEAFRSALSDLRQSRFFRDDPILEEFALDPKVLETHSDRVRVARALESRSLLGDLLTRTRKRDVLQNKVIRNPAVISVELNDEERELYNGVTERLRERAYQSDNAQTFAMIARQRQLASSIPAALQGWKEKETLAEILQEDLGCVLDEDEINLASATFDDLMTRHDFEANDSKYEKFSAFLKERWAQDPSEKIVVFSFYRGTIRYLERRLRAEGAPVAVILGGMGEAKQDELARFADPSGARILLSSEVGSEGIDLQFSRVVVNYDLPWNPMRVEQRIGRIDRLGQKADRIQVVSFILADTIEEIMLERLYNRIKVFEESIGDLEEILGPSLDELVLEYFRDGLSDEEMAKRLDQNALAAERCRRDLETLEEEAPELVGHTDFVLSNIQQSRDAGRWIRPEDVLTFVTDFLMEHYPGSSIEADPLRSGIYRISLTPEARAALSIYIDNRRPSRATRLHVPGTTVQAVFDIKLQGGVRPRPEIIDITHPLLLWIRSEIERIGRKSEPVTAVEVSSAEAGLPPDLYVFATDLWRFEGLRKDIRLRHMVMSATSDEFLPTNDAERLIDTAARLGTRTDLQQYGILSDDLMEAYARCEDELLDEFFAERNLFRGENKRRIKQALLVIEERGRKKLSQLRERLDNQRRSNDQKRQKAAYMTEGLIKKAEADLEQRRARIRANENPETTNKPVAGGIIVIRE